MKSIEEKAYSCVDKIFSEIIDKYQSAPWNEFRDALAQIYLAGATETLTTQWRSVEDELPEIDEEVVVIFTHSIHPNYAEKAIAYFDGEDWYKTDGEHIRPTHWLPIPEPPKN